MRRVVLRFVIQASDKQKRATVRALRFGSIFRAPGDELRDLSEKAPFFRLITCRERHFFLVEVWYSKAWKKHDVASLARARCGDAGRARRGPPKPPARYAFCPNRSPRLPRSRGRRSPTPLPRTNFHALCAKERQRVCPVFSRMPRRARVSRARASRPRDGRARTRAHARARARARVPRRATRSRARASPTRDARPTPPPPPACSFRAFREGRKFPLVKFHDSHRRFPPLFSKQDARSLSLKVRESRVLESVRGSKRSVFAKVAIVRNSTIAPAWSARRRR